MRFLFILWISPLLVFGQSKRPQPGKLYGAGETLNSPRYGVTTTVPTGWTGLLPRESEVFLLSHQYSPVEIYIFAREQGDLNTIKSNWEKGVDMDTNIRLKAKSASIKDGILSSEVVLTGGMTDKSKRGYCVARCSEYGPCVTLFGIMPASKFDSIRKDVDRVAASLVFSKPSTGSIYANFDWKKFLSAKALITLTLTEKGSKESRIDLCSDGTFTAQISKRGIMKNQNPQYKGRLSGTWTAEGIGETGKLILEFKKLPAIEADLRIEDEKIYGNGERYFVGETEKCK